MFDPEELADRTNHIGHLLDQARSARGNRERRLVSEALHYSCRMLEALNSTSLPVWSSNDLPSDDIRQWTEALLSLAGDRRGFEQFLAVERSLLLASGLDESIVRWIINEIRFVPRILEQPGYMIHDESAAQHFGEAINRLTRYVCRGAQEGDRLMRTKTITRGLLSSLGGVCTVACNVAADTVLSGVAIAASAAAGAGLVQDGVRVLIDGD